VVFQLVDSPDVMYLELRHACVFLRFFPLQSVCRTVSWVQEVSSESASDADGRVSLGLREMENWRMY